MALYNDKAAWFDEMFRFCFYMSVMNEIVSQCLFHQNFEDVVSKVVVWTI